jgi:hypothetical protein
MKFIFSFVKQYFVGPRWKVLKTIARHTKKTSDSGIKTCPFQVKWAVPYCIWIAKGARIAKTIGHCRSIKSRSNDCRSNKCRSNDCQSIECRSNDIIPEEHRIEGGIHQRGQNL